MFRIHLTRIAVAIAVVAGLAGCDTTSQPVAQASSAKSKKYYSEDTPETGSHIPKRYAVDDPNKPADKLGDNSATNLLVDPTLAGPKPSAAGGTR